MFNMDEFIMKLLNGKSIQMIADLNTIDRHTTNNNNRFMAYC